jgi:PadR family transcriptional regulator, regulatory protein AphA
MASDIALLGFLHTEQLHGYEIYQRFSNLPGLWEIWRIKQSRLYAMLARLESKGLVQANTLPQENRPARKVFRISKAGREAYQTWLVQPVDNGREFRLEFLVKLFFAVQEGPQTKNDLIESQMAASNSWLNEEQQALQALEAHQSFKKAIHSFRVGQVEAMLAWLSSVDSLDFSQSAV